jgi:tryptophan-rich sensory protein
MKHRSSTQSGLGLAGWILVTFLAPLGAIFAPPGAWYLALNKPSWNPPPWLFAPVWTGLYLGMALAAWLVWKQGDQPRALRRYFVQLALNALWTPVFFGAHQAGAALVVIMALWLAIVLTLRAFWAVDRLAGWLLLPYLMWVSFATFLNFTIWRLNR